MTVPLLTAVDVRRSFGPTLALDGASCSVAAGEIVALMGPSGSGKSTRLHSRRASWPPTREVLRLQGRYDEALEQGRRAVTAAGRAPHRWFGPVAAQLAIT